MDKNTVAPFWRTVTRIFFLPLCIEIGLIVIYTLVRIKRELLCLSKLKQFDWNLSLANREHRIMILYNM